MRNTIVVPCIVKNSLYRGGEHRAVGTRQLEPDEQRLDTTHEEERERERAVHDRDLLVVDRGEPAPGPRGRARPLEDADPASRRFDECVRVFDGRHGG